jgi:hypothetical protein
MAYNHQSLKSELPQAEPVWAAAAKSNAGIPFAQAVAVSDEQQLYQVPSYGADAPMMYDTEARRAKKKAEDEARRNWHIASFILSALLIASILATLLLHSEDGRGAFIFISCFLALIYLIEAFAKSESFKYLWNAGSSHSALDALSALQRVPPEISATVQCYHYENRYSESTHTNADVSSLQQIIIFITLSLSYGVASELYLHNAHSASALLMLFLHQSLTMNFLCASSNNRVQGRPAQRLSAYE